MTVCLFSCSASVLRKKASSAFGIEFDDAKYQKIVEHLEKIENTRELVRFVLVWKNLYNKWIWLMENGNL